MTPKGILRIARSLIDEKEWVRHTFHHLGENATGGRAGGANGNFGTSTIVVDGKEIPTVQAVKSACALGFLELALLSKGIECPIKIVGNYDEADSGQFLLDTTEMNVVRPYVEEAIMQFEANRGLTEWERDSLEDDYKWYLDDRALYSGPEEELGDPVSFEEYASQSGQGYQFDSVEDWNDSRCESKEELIAVFDIAVELAPNRIPDGMRGGVGAVTAALTA
jgi:hypothetical protein